MINPQSKRPVTVEDLLRFKRAERPAVEFWDEFDQELRAKQLAALVEKRPWWRRLPRTIAGTARYHLPLGATAVLAVTLLSIRDYHPAEPAYVPTADNEPATLTADAAPTSVAAPSVTAPSDQSAAVMPTETTTVAVEPAASPAAESATTASPVEMTVPGTLTRMMPMLAAQDPGANYVDLRPSVRSIAENRVTAAAILGTPSGFETRVLPVRSAPLEPLAQMANPAETRRSRFAAAFASMAVDTTTATSARVARRLSDEQLYDTIRRFGASGSSVSFKF